MNKENIERIFNDIFPGCTFYYRDTQLDQVFIDKYVTNQILMERGFVDMTYKGGGPLGNVRYLIASSKGKNISAFNPELAQMGHVLIEANAYFKVLDIYNKDKVTQILLLHITQESVPLFKSTNSNIETQIISRGRKSLDEKINLPILPELINDDWRSRTKNPIGMDDQGVFFYT